MVIAFLFFKCQDLSINGILGLEGLVTSLRLGNNCYQSSQFGDLEFLLEGRKQFHSDTTSSFYLVALCLETSLPG